MDDKFSKAEEFLDKIGDSLSDLDFEGLNDSIRESVDYIRREAEKGYKDFRMPPSKEKIKYSKYYETPYERYKAAQNRRGEVQGAVYREEREEREETRRVLSRIPGKLLGIFETAVGVSGLVIFGGLTLMFGIPALITALTGGIVSGIAAGLLGLSIPFTIASAVLFGHGVFSRNRAKRLMDYEKELRGKDYMMIDDLVAKTGYSEKQIRKDIHFIEAGGIAPGLTMDEKETCLLLTDQARKQYSDAEEARIRRELEELKKKEEQEHLEMKKKLASKEERELMRFNEEMNAFLDDLQVKKTEIDSPDLRQYMDEIEVLLKQISECIKEHPEMISGTGHLISYYLPCMSKLLTTYEDLEEQPIQGENIQKTKQEIEDSFLTIRSALTNMYDELFLNVSMDISSDIQVMNAILAQDGLNDDLHSS